MWIYSSCRALVYLCLPFVCVSNVEQWSKLTGKLLTVPMAIITRLSKMGENICIGFFYFRASKFFDENSNDFAHIIKSPNPSSELIVRSLTFRCNLSGMCIGVFCLIAYAQFTMKLNSLTFYFVLKIFRTHKQQSNSTQLISPATKLNTLSN